MNKDSRILVTGDRGLVGSATIRELKKQGYKYLLIAERHKWDLRNKYEVEEYFNGYQPDYVINCAGKVGGINANNTQSAEFIYDNLMIQTNIIDACYRYKVKKLLFLSSSCVYPRDCPQPIKEEYLLSSKLEETNIGYAIAKISGMIMCNMYRKQYGCNFISVMPTNLYGENDSFHLTNSHVLPALIRKFHEAKVNNSPYVEFWGTGTPRREFLFVDDLAEALVFLMNNYDKAEHINIGTGEDISIKELVHMMKDTIGYEGEIMWNTKYPDGTMLKRLDVSKIHALGWHHKTSLEEGIKYTYKWFIENYKTLRK
jgi:GDP-L-fucose synthase